jgi:hypothetical protein
VSWWIALSTDKPGVTHVHAHFKLIHVDNELASRQPLLGLGGIQHVVLVEREGSDGEALRPILVVDTVQTIDDLHVQLTVSSMASQRVL